MNDLDNFSKVRALIVGDIMLDKYLWGDVTRISPEAPVPVVNLTKTNYMVGGAANVAANVVGLGASANLIGIVGNDAGGAALLEKLDEAGIASMHIVKSANRQTTVKTRIMAHNQQIVRLDQETREQLTAREERAVEKNIQKVLGKTDLIIISDYAKGILSYQILSHLINFGKENNKVVIIDPKGKDYTKYRDATIITPNKFEIAEACGCRADRVKEIIAAGNDLINDLNLAAVVVTRGEEGLILLEKSREAVIIEAVKRRVYDVTGAGDTFIATLGVALGAGKVLSEAVEIANVAAGMTVEKLGTAVIQKKILMRGLK